MAEIIYLYADRTSPVQSQKAPATGLGGTRVYVRETNAGIWIAHDEHDSKGGCFRNHETACRFAVDEFGANAEIVIQPLFSSQMRLSHFKQSKSVAHKVLARH
jgi:hypothetical protein